MKRPAIISIITLLAVLLAAGAFVPARGQAESASGAATEAITIDNFSFTPATLTIAAGTQVTWTNHDDVPHTVVNTDHGQTFKSRALDTDESYSYTFKDPGTYEYFCSLHPKMVARVVVKARN